MHNWRSREWTPAVIAAGFSRRDENGKLRPARRIYDLRHTYATFSLAAGVSLFALSRRMGTSVEMIDRQALKLLVAATATEVVLVGTAVLASLS